MKKSISVFVLMMLVIALLAAAAVYGVDVIGLKSVFEEDGVRMGLDLVGGTSISFEAVLDETESEMTNDEIMDSVVAVLNNRVTAAGYTEATVTRIKNNMVKVEIPDVDNLDEAQSLLGKVAKLKFADSHGNTVLEGSQVTSAKAATFQDEMGVIQYVVELHFDNSAKEAFAKATEEMSLEEYGNNYISIFLDDVEISRPFVDEAIYQSECIIQGGFTAESARELANLISSGNLPVELKQGELRNVSATLGAEALSRALLAGIIGIVLVMLFMIVFYRLPGVVSAIALVCYIALTAICISFFKINLSLPGIAGIFLTIGMAVDANVIIFERIKEELLAGKSVRGSVKSGFNSAFTAVLDSNVTTIIAAVVLWNLGTGAIVGFAKTLFLGVVLSMITAVFVTKVLLNALVDMGITNIKLFGARYADEN